MTDNTLEANWKNISVWFLATGIVMREEGLGEAAAKAKVLYFDQKGVQNFVERRGWVYDDQEMRWHNNAKDQ